MKKLLIAIAFALFTLGVSAQKLAEDSGEFLCKEGICFVEKNDMENAISCFSEAAEHGYATAYFYLGGIYMKEECGHLNPKLGLSYWKRGADLGDAKCQYHYGCALKDGDGIAKNEKHAIYWLVLAAKSGYNDAIIELNEMNVEYRNPSIYAYRFKRGQYRPCEK